MLKGNLIECLLRFANLPEANYSAKIPRPRKHNFKLITKRFSTSGCWTCRFQKSLKEYDSREINATISKQTYHLWSFFEHCLKSFFRNDTFSKPPPPQYFTLSQDYDVCLTSYFSVFANYSHVYALHIYTEINYYNWKAINDKNLNIW